MADYTKYRFNGKTNLYKNRLVLEVIKKYVEDHPDVSLSELNKIFPRSINGYHIIIDLIKNINEKEYRKGCYFLKDSIKLSNGENVAVTSEWGMDNLKKIPNTQDFIKKAKELGYEIVESEDFFPETTDEHEPKDPKDSDLPTADEFLHAFIQFFSKKSGNSENQKKILQFHLNQESYSTTARIITENLGLTNIGHANMLCGHLAKGLCQILGKMNLRYFVEILFDFKKTNDFNNELQWILHPPVVEALNRFFSMSEEEKNDFVENSEKNKPVKKTKENDYPLNLILYGPPGTGKTYNTFNKALEILGEDVDGKSRDDIEEIFKSKINDGQIVFTTFHQSMSYEDFIEGIKPVEPKQEGHPIVFKVKSGILKSMCERIKNSEKITSFAINPDRTILNFNQLYSAFLERLKEIISELEENETHYFESRKSKVKIIKIEGDNILTSGETANSTEMIKKEKMERIYNKFKSPDEITNIVKQLREIGTDIGWTTNYFAVFKAIKDFEKSITLENPKNEVTVPYKKNYVLIIDEINRGNISRIFGELITLIEEDKRDGRLTVKLPYSQEDFTVPSNLFIIGTMNTADRSIALLDIALRRRFTFFRFDPDSRLVKFPKAKNIMEKLNEEIVKSKGKDFQIGHSYFMKVKDEKELKAVIDFKIKPLLEEYFVNDPNKLDKLNKLVDDGFRND